MRTIEVDEDVYQHILRRAIAIGESASEILRRELGVAVPDTRRNQDSPQENSKQTDSDDLRAFVKSPEFLRHSSAVSRYLALLSHIYRKDPKRFADILNLSGRERKYFATSKDELLKHGRSVHPRNIPGTPYWAVTNTDSSRKVRMLADVLRLLGYSSDLPTVVGFFGMPCPSNYRY